jgi:hypothetical protein
MPALSLVICVHEEADLLERTLGETAGEHDDLVVVHDGPERIGSHDSVETIVDRYGGRFFVRSRAFQQEPHWPFAWQQAKYDWILRLDADEFPSPEMKEWLWRFREGPEPEVSISGYTCIWPLWDGEKAITQRWPCKRIFLFHKQRVQFFGMAEQVPVADIRWESVPLILEHRPPRKSYGFANLLLRTQAYRWRHIIARSLLGKPTDLPCWRWTNEKWPQIWEEIRLRPLRTGFYRLLIWPLMTLREMWRADRRIIPSAALSGGIHHCLIALEYFRLKYFKSRV